MLLNHDAKGTKYNLTLIDFWCFLTVLKGNMIGIYEVFNDLEVDLI